MHPQNRAFVSKEKSSNGNGRPWSPLEQGAPVETDVSSSSDPVLGETDVPSPCWIVQETGEQPSSWEPRLEQMCSTEQRTAMGSIRLSLGGRIWKKTRPVGPDGNYTVLANLHSSLFSCPPHPLPATRKSPSSLSGIPWSQTSEFINTFYNYFPPHKAVAALLTAGAGEFSSGSFPKPGKQQSQASPPHSARPTLNLFSSSLLSP